MEGLDQDGNNDWTADYSRELKEARRALGQGVWKKLLHMKVGLQLKVIFIILKCQKIVKNGRCNFPKTKMTSSNVSCCLKTIGEE